MGFTRRPYRMWSGELNTGCLLRERESSSCSVNEGACLPSPSLVLESWKTPGGLLDFSLCWNLEGFAFNGSLHSRIDELTRDGGKADPPSFMAFYVGCQLKGVVQA